MADNMSTIAAHQGRMDTNMIQVGIVKDNRDPKKMGRLKVWIENSSSLEGSKSGWITCSYASPFAGNTKGVPNAKGFGDYPKSYGFWAVPPDVGTRVFVFFVNGRQELAFWFGCAYDTNMNGMVPAPGASVMNDSEHNGPIPVVEYDRNSPNGDVNARYINAPLLDGLLKQKIAHDPLVGAINRSSRRQAPAQVYGMSTPRGNHIVLDDGYLDSELVAKYWDDNADDIQHTETGNPANDTVVGARKCEGILLRTRSGAQIFISESDGFIFMINRDGTARMSMSAEGDIEFNGRDIKLRATRNLELRADQNMKTEVYGKSNTMITGTTQTEHKGKYEFTCHADSVTNVDGHKNVYVKGGLALQGDASVHVSSPSNVNVEAKGSLNLIGSSGIKMTGGRGNAALNGDLNVSMSVSAGGDVTSSSSSLDKHSHANVQNGNGVTPPPSSGSGKEPDAPAAATAFKASESTTTRHELKQVKDVVAVQAGGKVDKKLQKDIGVSQSSSLSAMSAVMPATGSIDSAGYWGEKVKQADGKVADNPGWLIMGSSNVAAMYGGYVVNRTTNTVQIDHGNGFQSMYKGIKVSDAIQDGTDVTTGQIIGSYKDKFLFEVRSMGAPLYGFVGTIDPGRFFIEETGVGSAAANKSLTIKKKTNSSVQVVPTAEGGSEMVSLCETNTICDSVVLSGSKHVPGNRKTSELLYNDARENRMYQETNKSPVFSDDGWVVTASDPTLKQSIMDHEGQIAIQTKYNFYRNGKFYPYPDAGRWAIGYGRNFENRNTYINGVTKEVALNMLYADTQTAIYEARKIYDKEGLRIPKNAQLVLSEMCYQMGGNGVRGFKEFLAALKQGDYKTAINELRASKLNDQTESRVDYYVSLLDDNTN